MSMSLVDYVLSSTHTVIQTEFHEEVIGYYLHGYELIRSQSKLRY